MHPCLRSFVRLALAGSLAYRMACGGPTAPAVRGVTIDQGNVTLSEGASTALTFTVQAVGGASKAVTWTSGAPLIAEVDAAGVVTGMKPCATVTLPLHVGVDVTVDWGDGSSEVATVAGNRDHTYAAEGVYEIAIRGSLTRFGEQWVA